MTFFLVAGQIGITGAINLEGVFSGSLRDKVLFMNSVITDRSSVCLISQKMMAINFYNEVGHSIPNLQLPARFMVGNVED